MGAVAGHFVTDHQIHFSGGFKSPEGGYEEVWTFEPNRLTRRATLKEKNKRPVVPTSGWLPWLLWLLVLAGLERVSQGLLQHACGRLDVLDAGKQRLKV